MLLSFFRAVHNLADNAELPGFLWISTISTYDPFFVAPLLFGAGNYFLIEKTHLGQIIPQRLKVGISMASALAVILTPVCYLQTWIGIGAAHVGVNQLRALLKTYNRL
jgi:hypothetical protein